MTHNEAAKYANDRLRDFMLQGTIPTTWRFEWGRGKRRLGCCKYGPQTISLSHHYVSVANDEDIKDTVNHEIAHIIAGRAAGHGYYWKLACGITGAKPIRCAEASTMEDVPSKYVGKCPTCGQIINAHRALKDMDRRVCAKMACRKARNYIKWEVTY